MKGVYVVFFELEREKVVEVGALGRMAFEPGVYAYAGSAMNNAEKRIRRHFSSDKKDFWHIDYFSRIARPLDYFILPETSEYECVLADIVSNLGEPIDDFGCSDCDCQSHLFRIYNLD